MGSGKWRHLGSPRQKGWPWARGCLGASVAVGIVVPAWPWAGAQVYVLGRGCRGVPGGSLLGDSAQVPGPRTASAGALPGVEGPVWEAGCLLLEELSL